MPQPYPKHLTPNFVVGEAIIKRHALSLAGMHAVTQYSMLEPLLSVVMTKLLGSDPRPAVAILAVIKNSSIRNEALRSVAEESLNADDLALFNAVLGVVDSADKERNRLAHWLWAIDDQLPDAVVLLDPRKYASMNSDVAVAMAKGSTSVEQATALQDKMRSMALVYRQQDFQTAINAVERAFFAITNLTIVLDKPNDPSSANARKLLLGSPEIQRALGLAVTKQQPGEASFSKTITS